MEVNMVANGILIIVVILLILVLVLLIKISGLKKIDTIVDRNEFQQREEDNKELSKEDKKLMKELERCKERLDKTEKKYKEVSQKCGKQSKRSVSEDLPVSQKLLFDYTEFLHIYLLKYYGKEARIGLRFKLTELKKKMNKNYDIELLKADPAKIEKILLKSINDMYEKGFIKVKDQSAVEDFKKSSLEFMKNAILDLIRTEDSEITLYAKLRDLQKVGKESQEGLEHNVYVMALIILLYYLHGMNNKK